jgi:hypothetical protein
MSIEDSAMATVGLPHLLLAETRKNLLLLLRYPLQPLVGILITVLLFVGMSFGIEHYVALALFDGGNQGVLVASFFCWIVAMGAVGHIAAELEEDIKIGVFEPIFLSRYPASAVILVRSLSSSISGLLMSFATLYVMVWYTGASLELSISSLLALVLLDVALSGIGLIMAGIVVLFKRAASIAPLLYLGFGVLIARQISLEPDDNLFLYPVSSALELFPRTLFGSEIPLPSVFHALAWALVTLACGVVVLGMCIDAARRKGSLSYY